MSEFRPTSACVASIDRRVSEKLNRIAVIDRRNFAPKVRNVDTTGGVTGILAAILELGEILK